MNVIRWSTRQEPRTRARTLPTGILSSTNRSGARILEMKFNIASANCTLKVSNNLPNLYIKKKKSYSILYFMRNIKIDEKVFFGRGDNDV